MEKQVIELFWTRQAEEDLLEIFEFYKIVSIDLADKMVQHLSHVPDILLVGFPRRGQIEDSLSGLGIEYRYLIEGNYKIVYWIDGKRGVIASVFDTRQDPAKLKKKLTK